MAKWSNPKELPARTFTCGHCGAFVGSNKGFGSDNNDYVVYICSNCTKATFCHREQQFPGVRYGNDIQNLPSDVKSIYDELRMCYQVSAFTSVVLCCRKMLMHIAVEKGADPNKSFACYVKYLEDKHYVPPDGRGWVDHIRDKGNEANHEITIATQGDAKLLIDFIEMLLRIVYDFPQRAPSP